MSILEVESSITPLRFLYITVDIQDDKTLVSPTMTSSHAKKCDGTEWNCESQRDKERTSTKQPREVVKRTISGWGSSKLSAKFRKYEI